VNLSDPSTPQPVKDRVLGSYKKAISEMLKRPPEDPLNWYRNALIHTVDCPHGNWWFLVWHRGYIGWFERKCRELSGDPEFALPYWDWTTEQHVPDYMFEDVLDPNNGAFIGKHDDFKSKFKDAVRNLDYWDLNPDGTPSDKYGQVLARGIRFPDDLWFDIIESPPQLSGLQSPNLIWETHFFFDQPQARGLKKGEEFDDGTKFDVFLPTILNALSPRDFLTFASPKARGGHNVQVVGFGVLEGLPHNQVHNCVGGGFNGTQGFMLNFLSPVDPIFFLHHANIDRLWDVWTRKQAAFRLPTLPEGNDLAAWSNEAFLFFVDERNHPVKSTAGDYATIGDFNYDYQPGSGEEVVPTAVIAATPAITQIQRFSGEITAPPLTATQEAGGTITIPPALVQAGAEPGGPKLFAKITVALPPLGHAPLTVLINAPAGSMDTGSSNPYFGGTLSMFGTMVMHGPVTFTVPLSTTLSTLRTRNLLAVNQPLDIRVVPSAMAHALTAPAAAPKVEVISLVVEAH
jgi:tyrosinase